MAARRERITFPGGDGAELSAKVELPAGPIRGAAVFAHCFTCSSDAAAAARISVGLAEAGIAVMRFDFTGLGASEGDFADTNFSTNVADLIAAAAALSDRYEAPGLLIGHSLGGAAVLAAAPELASVKAVVTIGAPAEPGHVTRLLAGGLAQLEADGEATIDIGGRPFQVKAQLLDDLRSRTIDECLPRLGAALLVMHSPVDNVVGVENAAAIYQAARHPKSFVALDGADHLLTDRADAAFAAAMISAWVERYLDAEPPPVSASADGVVVSELGEGKFLNQVVAGAHRLVMDEPQSVGGFDAGPNPYELLAAALGGCTSMTMRMYAERKGIPLDRAEVEVRHDKVHCDDCEATAGGATPKIDRFERRLRLTGDLTDDQREGLLRIADRCPVHLTLERSSLIETELLDLEPAK
ncbi:MAG: bifunctional alpha/beta hydrolase/OsmC family protein [Microthrixaceae bacterium]